MIRKPRREAGAEVRIVSNRPQGGDIGIHIVSGLDHADVASRKRRGVLGGDGRVGNDVQTDREGQAEHNGGQVARHEEGRKPALEGASE